VQRFCAEIFPSNSCQSSVSDLPSSKRMIVQCEENVLDSGISERTQLWESKQRLSVELKELD
jgi:hypothetical protein